jgi:hypothetical protein
VPVEQMPAALRSYNDVVVRPVHLPLDGSFFLVAARFRARNVHLPRHNVLRRGLHNLNVEIGHAYATALGAAGILGLRQVAT